MTPRPSPPPASLDELAAHPAVWAAGAVLALLLAHAAWSHFRLAAPRRAARRRATRAMQGQREAEALCEKLGYQVLGVQPEYTWQVEVDGELREVLLRPDLVIERDGLTFIADVKTGGQAPDPLHPATRRQLLEYQLACGVDGVLVVDMEARRIRRLGFVLPGGSAPSSLLSRALWPLLTLLAGVAAGGAGARWLWP